MPNIKTPRYIVTFDPKRIVHRFADVLVIGSGLAGLRAALAVAPEQSVLLVTKDRAQQSNSTYAQGGIAAVWDPEDQFELHAEDTVGAGKGLCDRRIVDLVVQQAPERIRELIEWGAAFDQRDGQIDLTREGGHSVNRILHSMGDATGRELVRAVLERARRQRNVQIMEDTFTVDLLTHDGRCVGALTWSREIGVQAIWSSETVLATGGCGQLYRETTNPPVATGDGLAVAYRAGAQLQDMEFMQFHPTVLYVAGSARTLISEAVRGEGAYLRDRAGDRFMPRYDPRAELAPRDVVAKAIVTQMSATQHPCVYLDLRHLDAQHVRGRFPGFRTACEKCGLDIAHDLIPVRPGAHYMVGGVSTSADGRTSLPGLWAAGEVSATGLHGANRLASNSLLEALVFGEICGRGASQGAADRADGLQAFPIAFQMEPTSTEPLDLQDIRNSLQSLMFRDVGVERDASGLDEAARSVEFWSQYVQSRKFDGPTGWELQNLLTVAGLVILSAQTRTESRGTHNRSDFPQTDPNWRCHLVVTRDSAAPKTMPVEPR